jgi:hypothetical protein
VKRLLQSGQKSVVGEELAANSEVWTIKNAVFIADPAWANSLQKPVSESITYG